MEMNPFVSVIVPIYKAEGYIHRCLDSLLAQTMSDFELLLIDDGSPDRSGEICDEYAKRDSRIRVIHKENGGVASARQFGMDNAQGEYIIHVDSDDWVEPNMLEELYNEAIEKKADVVICDYWVDNERIVKQQPSVLDHITILQELFQQLHGSCWNKLIRKACLENYPVKFHKELTYCEDLTFWIQFFQFPVHTVYFPKAYYHYLTNSASIVHTYVNSKNDEGWKLIKYFRKDLVNYPKLCRRACTRFSYYIVITAFRNGNFSTFSFTKRYCKYVPFLLMYNDISLSERFFWARVCLGMYGYYKVRIIGS